MQSDFLGRDKELKELRNLFKLRKSALVVCRGRRRIGKSRLIQEFGKEADSFIEIQGLSPRESITKKEQLQTFSEQFAKQTGFPRLRIESWEQAFSLLNKAVANKRTIILLDEISWLAHGDKDFAGKLKIAWDIELKKHHNLVFVLCGSVSSWLEKNILNNTGFAGRISLDLKLEELDIASCSFFWGKDHRTISIAEKLKVLCVTGGVPSYLEEVRPDIPAEENIHRMCFKREGLLFSEFEHIFSSIFSRRANTYRKILESLIYSSRDLDEISRSIGIEKSGTLSAYLDDLTEAGFVYRDTSYNLANFRVSKFSRYRLKDNYTRFYLRYIKEKKELISTSLTINTNLETFIEWDIIRGFQFENLVINNLNTLLGVLDINSETIVFAGPYYQKKNKKQEACQIDLLIVTKYSMYVCEMKFRSIVKKKVISEVIDKVGKLNNPRNLSLRPVLIYNGRLDSAIRSEGYFNSIVSMEQFFNTAGYT